MNLSFREIDPETPDDSPLADFPRYQVHEDGG